MFTVPGVDNVPDLFGDINDPQLVVFFAGNQFMCIDDLMAAFRKGHPQYKRIFAETLPPGILAKADHWGLYHHRQHAHHFKAGCLYRRQKPYRSNA